MNLVIDFVYAVALNVVLWGWGLYDVTVLHYLLLGATIVTARMGIAMAGESFATGASYVHRD